MPFNYLVQLSSMNQKSSKINLNRLLNNLFPINSSRAHNLGHVIINLNGPPMFSPQNLRDGNDSVPKHKDNENHAILSTCEIIAEITYTTAYPSFLTSLHVYMYLFNNFKWLV